MQNHDRRTVLAASAVGAVGLVASTALAQDERKRDEQEQDGYDPKSAAPGVNGGEKRTSATKQWYGGTWPGVGALITYINSPPAQGAGEVQIVRVGQDGTVTALVYL